ncbi:MAG: V-type ATP synthase subunit E family protein, partial [Planctomycetota bacterium]
MSHEEQTLIEEIKADARRRAQRAKQRAEREARGIIAKAEEEALRERERAMEEAARAMAHEREVNAARIEQEVGRLRLQVRQDVLEHVRQEAGRRLAELADGPEHGRALRKLAVAAIGAMSGERFQLALRTDERGERAQRLLQDVR